MLSEELLTCPVTAPPCALSPVREPRPSQRPREHEGSRAKWIWWEKVHKAEAGGPGEEDAAGLGAAGHKGTQRPISSANPQT